MGIATIPAPSSAGVTQKVQEFTSTGTFTVPSNVTAVQVFLVGGGGGGGYTNSAGAGDYGGGGGGGGGQVVNRTISVTAGASYTVTIGAGGAGGTSGTPGGSKGGDTTFGALATASGGGGGGGINLATTPTSNFVGANGANGGGCGQGSGGRFAAGCGGGSGTPGQQVAYSSTSGWGNFYDKYTYGGSPTAGNAGGMSAEYNRQSVVIAGAGIDGYGNGGGGGGHSPTVATEYRMDQSVTRSTYITGSTQSQAGTNATANTGNGGSGGSSNLASANGGSGGSGFARVTYWS